jgi:molybdopterin-guanine dinucleotide biosynthesis protein A
VVHNHSCLPLYSLGASPKKKSQRFLDLVVPILSEQGLRIAVVHDERAGACPLDPAATTCSSPEEGSFHAGDVCHFLLPTWTAASIFPWMSRLSRNFDLVLSTVVGETEIRQIVLQADNATDDRQDDPLLLAEFESNPLDAARTVIVHLQGNLASRPVWACILIGGKSSRMGRPKHLLQDESGRTWLERTVETVLPHVEGIALSGSGIVPSELQSHTRLPDVPGVAGPLTGILSAMRWQPDVSWLLLACDMPTVTADAVKWLLSQRRPGQWGIVPRIRGEKRAEPLFAGYEPQSREYFERMCADGTRRISSITGFDRIRVIEIPQHLQNAWLNVNTPAEFDVLSL